MEIELKYERKVEELLKYLREADRLGGLLTPLSKKVDEGTDTDADRAQMVKYADDIVGALAAYEDSLGSGRLQSALAESQTSLLRQLEAAARAKNKAAFRAPPGTHLCADGTCLHDDFDNEALWIRTPALDRGDLRAWRSPDLSARAATIFTKGEPKPR